MEIDPAFLNAYKTTELNMLSTITHVFVMFDLSVMKEGANIDTTSDGGLMHWETLHMRIIGVHIYTWASEIILLIARYHYSLFFKVSS